MKHMALDSTQKNGFIYQGEFVSEVCALLHEFYSSKPWVQSTNLSFTKLRGYLFT